MFVFISTQLFDRMCMALGGRAAEAKIFRRVTTGMKNEMIPLPSVVVISSVGEMSVVFVNPRKRAQGVPILVSQLAITRAPCKFSDPSRFFSWSSGCFVGHVFSYCHPS